jgi:hypothetical protein
VRKFAQPFVDWLRSAEAESEEEDDEWSNQLADSVWNQLHLLLLCFLVGVWVLWWERTKWCFRLCNPFSMRITHAHLSGCCNS